MMSARTQHFGRVWWVALLAAALAAALLLTLVAATQKPAQAAFPGKNGKIAFLSTRDGGSRQIYTMNPDGSSQTRLTYPPSTGEGNAWSPYGGPAWSPDGTKIAFEGIRWDVDSSGYIYLINADNGSEATLVTPGVNPAFSPDGTKLVFDMENYDSPHREHDIYVANSDGSGPFPQTRLTSTDSSNDYYPAWSPDGTKIAFVSYPDEAGLEAACQGICVMNSDGSGLTPLTNNMGVQSGPEWSPGGNKIAFGMGGEIYTINADGSNLANITNSPTEESDPTWSPDGAKIAFGSWRDGNPDIYAMDADGSNPIRLTNDPAYDTHPSWQPIPLVYDFGGFYQPVDNLPTLNKTKPGKTIPVRFGLGGDKGLDVFASGYPRSQAIPCDSTVAVDSIEETVMGNGGLSYNATTGRYEYKWATSRNWRGTCRQFEMKLKDGSVQRANFTFR